MKFKLIVSIGLISALSLPAFAAKEKSKSSVADSVNIYTDCGIGAAIFSNHPVAAAISNVIWDLGTTAATSAISSKGSCSGKGAKAAMLINETYPALADETTKGQGQHLSAVVNILGCDAKHEELAIKAIRADFANLLNVEGYESQSHITKAQNYFNIVNSNVEKTCDAS